MTKNPHALHGSMNGRSKLTERQRATIRASKMPLMKLAHRYGVHLATIVRVKAK